MMFDDVRTSLVDQGHLVEDRLVVVGVSGGPDSLCLLDILDRCGYPVLVAHLDHSLRDESAADLLAVQQVAGAMGLELVTERVDVRGYARSKSMSLEEAAREARYKFLFQAAEQRNAQAVLVGHTADDQVETMLMHLLRGAGLAGLQGMPYRALPNAWSSVTPLVRPLLGCWREQVESYLEQRDLQPLFDPSNLDTRYYRNRLRHELIPYLESYNPKVRQLLWRTAATLGDDYRLIESLVDDAWEACLEVSGASYLGFNAAALKELPQSIQNHLYRRAIYHLREELRDVDYQAIRRIHRFLVDPPGTMHVDLIAGLELALEGELLWLFAGNAQLPVAEWPQIQRGEIYYLPVPGFLTLGNHWVLRAEPWIDVGEVLDRAAGNLDPYRAWIDGERLSIPLVVRSRLPGDRIKPLGMGGQSLKVADLMVNEKVPRRLRDRWPVVISAGEVVWLPGIRLAEGFKVSPQTDQAVTLHLVKGGSGS